MREAVYMYEEKTIETRQIYDGKILNVRLEKVELHNGNISTREIVSHPGGCGIIANNNGKIIFVKQFRKPINKSIIEIPAGKLDQNEDPLTCAKRELQEETGYIATNIEKIGVVMTSPGYSDEIIHIYYADNLILGEDNPDIDEFVDVIEIEIPEVLRMCTNGEIGDGKTLAGFMLAMKHLKI